MMLLVTGVSKSRWGALALPCCLHCCCCWPWYWWPPSTPYGHRLLTHPVSNNRGKCRDSLVRAVCPGHPQPQALCNPRVCALMGVRQW